MRELRFWVAAGLAGVVAVALVKIAGASSAGEKFPPLRDLSSVL